VFRAIEECFLWSKYFSIFLFNSLFLMVIFLNAGGHFFGKGLLFGAIACFFDGI
jgi:hypothetical protein